MHACMQTSEKGSKNLIEPQCDIGNIQGVSILSVNIFRGEIFEKNNYFFRQ